jgi:cold shock CspA family protein/ribosome-associated translation inhibitor RaiA
MQVEPETVFEGMDPSTAVEAAIAKEVTKLEQFYDRITACRVVIEAPHQRHQKGKLYNVRIHLTLPGQADVVASRHPGAHHAHEDAYVAIRDAFKAARRQLQDRVRTSRGQVKVHPPVPHGRVVRLFAERGYGFIETPAGDALYFHRNSVLNDGFDTLSLDAEVRFVAEIGEHGPQASSVQLIGKHHPS